MQSVEPSRDDWTIQPRSSFAEIDLFAIGPSARLFTFQPECCAPSHCAALEKPLKGLIMSNAFLFSALSFAGICLSCTNAQACHGSGCATVACTPSSVAPAAPAAADPHAGMQAAQRSTGTGSYQSFSYEPNATPAPAYRRTPARSAPSTFDSFRGDRKALGQF